MSEQEVTVYDMMNAREKRSAVITQLIRDYHCTVVCFTMNIAGPVKQSPEIHAVWESGVSEFLSQLHAFGYSVLVQQCISAFTGNDCYLVVDAPVLSVKTIAVQLEEYHPAGRLFDIDVHSSSGRKAERAEVGFPPRKCLLCEKNASVCASRRLHTVAELREKTAAILHNYLSEWFSGEVSQLAVSALLYEVSVSPKPGLVDRCNNGPHTDMDYYTFLRSCSALQESFRKMVLCGIETVSLPYREVFSRLSCLGRHAEGQMLLATGNVNTHKGAICSFGLLCGAIGRLFSPGKAVSLGCLKTTCAQLFSGEIPDTSVAETNGIALLKKHGITGIRGELSSGLHHVTELALPVLTKCLREGLSEDEAGVVTLLHLLANIEDTNMIARSSPEIFRSLQAELSVLLHGTEPVSLPVLQRMNAEFTAAGLSPGGSADLLAATWFLYFLQQRGFLTSLEG